MNGIHELRSFVEALEEAGQLARISRPVSMRHELADVGAALERSGSAAGFFEQPEESPWPTFCGGVASVLRGSIALGCHPNEVVDVMEHVLEPAHGVGPVLTDNAPWKANSVVGSDVDTSLLPIPVHSRGDGGAFITGAVTVARDPVSGRGNLGYNRMLRLDRNRFGFNVNEWRDVGTFL